MTAHTRLRAVFVDLALMADSLDQTQVNWSMVARCEGKLGAGKDRRRRLTGKYAAVLLCCKSEPVVCPDVEGRYCAVRESV